jgi:hypothetical protein
MVVACARVACTRCYTAGTASSAGTAASRLLGDALELAETVGPQRRSEASARGDTIAGVSIVTVASRGGRMLPIGPRTPCLPCRS